MVGLARHRWWYEMYGLRHRLEPGFKGAWYHTFWLPAWPGVEVAWE
jgi:hypothetical protein